MGLTFSFEELEDALVGLSKKASEEVIDKALDAGAKPIIKSMIKEVPYDTHDLQKSLGEIGKTGRGAKREIHLGSTSTDREIIERGYYQEFGNSSMLGKKWMKRSYENSEEEAIEAMTNALEDNLFK